MLFKIFSILLFLSSSLLSKGFEEPWGKDSDLNKDISYQKPKGSSFAAKIAESVILFHQKVISPANGPRSNFRPSSSHYMQQAIQRYGFLKGYIMGCDRLLRENAEQWIYGNVIDDGCTYKFDPPVREKDRANDSVSSQLLRPQTGFPS